MGEKRGGAKGLVKIETWPRASRFGAAEPSPPPFSPGRRRIFPSLCRGCSAVQSRAKAGALVGEIRFVVILPSFVYRVVRAVETYFA